MKQFIGTIIFPFFCLFLSFFVLITDPAFTYLLLEKEESIGPTKQLMAFFAGKAEIPEIFNAEEKDHLADVKMTIQYSFSALLFLTAVLCYCLTSNRKKILRNGTLLLLGILILVSLAPFDKFFTIFHELVFPHGGWMFAPDTTIIMLYPINFFASYAIVIAVHSLIIAGMILFMDIVSRRG